MKIFIIYLIIVNFISFLSMGRDKALAVKGKRRIPEKSLFLVSAIGGAIGGWIGMKIWHHKTQKPSFVYGIPALFIIHLAILYFIIFNERDILN